MSEVISYREALLILSGAESKLLLTLDRAATAGLTAWAAGTVATGKDPTMVMGLIELKDGIVGYGNEIVRRVGDWRKGLSRYNRSQRLAAAHAVLVVTSYFETLEASDLPVAFDQLDFTDGEKAAVALGTRIPQGYAETIGFLLKERMPIPETHQSFIDVCRRLENFYSRISSRMVHFISGLAVFDSLDNAQRMSLVSTINDVPARALSRYREAYISLAQDNREFEVWAGLTEVHALGMGLERVHTLLSDMTQKKGSRPRVNLTRSYRAALSEPIAGAVEAPEDINLPTLAEAYINPRCRVAEVRASDAPAETEWWAQKDLVPDIEVFLTGWLTSPKAIKTPLVVLGEPGSGKSKLVEILAGRLPPQDFLPVIVPLRDVAAESIVQEQIEQAIYQGPGDQINWNDLREAAGDALPVVLLDGFDELIQAAAVNRYDYLEQVRDFQRRQAQIGCPVSVIVTSRTVVADYVRFPVGTMALQLQPFSEAQVGRWLEIWAQHNTTALEQRGLTPLSPGHALAHRELAEQPLLLMMLAIFDTTDNSLQRATSPIGRADLYERLLIGFAQREVQKYATNRALPAARQFELARREVQLLAMVAVSMFVRGQQVITEAELERDLPILFPFTEGHVTRDQSALGHAQRITGRFFFIYVSEARSGPDRVRSYEFLHSTFGEYLVARAIFQALDSLVAIRKAMEQTSSLGGRLDDGPLYAILSFFCLSGRAAIIDFLSELFESLESDKRTRFEEVLSRLFAESLAPQPSRSLQAFEPIACQIPRRLAVYSANLALMLVQVSSGIAASNLFGTTEAAERWRQYGYLWRGSLTQAEWRGFSDSIRARIRDRGTHVDIELTAEDGSPVSPLDSLVIVPALASREAGQFDIILAKDGTGASYDVNIPPFSTAGRAFRDAAFLPSWHIGVFLLQSIPAIRALHGEVRWQGSEDIGLLPGYLLAMLDYSRDATPHDRATHYAYCLDMMATNPQAYEQLMMRSYYDAPTFPPSLVVSLLRRANVVAPTRSAAAIVNHLWLRSDLGDNRPEVAKLVSDILGDWGTFPGLNVDLFG
jgi:energy-coupling factor transporter ATP-binding protein EcfA2